MHVSFLAIKLYKLEQIGDDLVFSVDLLIDITQKLTVYLGRRIGLCDERIGKDLNGCDRSFKLMRNVGNKFLSGNLKLLDLKKENRSPEERMIKASR